MTEIKKIDFGNLSEIAEAEAEIFSDAVSETALRTLFSCGGFGFIAYDDGDLSGFLYCSDAAGDTELLRIAVLPAFRRRGIGRELLLRLFEEAEACIFLEVRESNHAARGLYSSLGFFESGRRRGFYRSPSEDAILMTKEQNT